MFQAAANVNKKYPNGGKQGGMPRDVNKLCVVALKGIRKLWLICQARDGNVCFHAGD